MNFKFFALACICLFRSLGEPANAAHAEPGSDDRPHYVVIGAFRVYKNAIRFANRAHKNLKMDAKFEMNQFRKLYYVYVLRTADQDLAITEARRLREESEFRDTWVYFGTLGAKGLSEGKAIPGQDINPVTAQKLQDVDKADEEKTDVTATIDASTKPVTPTTTEENMKSLDDTPGKNFLFKVFRAADNVTLEGDVDAIDTDKAKKFGTYKSNVPVKLPANNMKQVSFVCEVFGYRKLQRDLDYVNPDAGGLLRDENSGAVIVPFELMPLQKGDIAIMYNVFFYRDAAIMRPESRFEVNTLLTMMTENPKYRIRLHGHTNGGAAGKLISMEKDSKNFFSLEGAKEGFSTAKELSEERADVIRKYLISNGVDAARVEIKAWGGKRPIHDKNSARAQENVRVEVEILEQ